MKRTMNCRVLWKCALPVMAFLGAGLLTACDKEPEQKPEPTETTPIDPVKVLRFGQNVSFDTIGYENVMKYANNPHITTIIYFLDSTDQNNNYTGYSTESISKLRDILQERLDYTPKATGAGTFIFARGALIVEDSLWYVANGWQIRTW